jgi:hypothetical protein
MESDVRFNSANKFRRVSVALFVAISCLIAASFAFFTTGRQQSVRTLFNGFGEAANSCFSSKTQVNVLHKGHLVAHFSSQDWRFCSE